MRADIKQEWVRRLRSGEYKQGKSFLARKNDEDEWTHCCLGVLCELSGIGSQSREALFSGPLTFKTFGKGATRYLPPSLARKYGVTERQQEKLGGMNDDGYSFNEIADWIEENL